MCCSWVKGKREVLQAALEWGTLHHQLACLVGFGGQGGKQEDTSYLAEAGVRSAVRQVEGSKARLLMLCYFVQWQL